MQVLSSASLSATAQQQRQPAGGPSGDSEPQQPPQPSGIPATRGRPPLPSGPRSSALAPSSRSPASPRAGAGALGAPEVGSAGAPRRSTAALLATPASFLPASVEGYGYTPAAGGGGSALRQPRQYLPAASPLPPPSATTASVGSSTPLQQADGAAPLTRHSIAPAEAQPPPLLSPPATLQRSTARGVPGSASSAAPWHAISGADALTGVVFLPLGGGVSQQPAEASTGGGTVSLLDRLSGLSLNELEQRIDRILSEDPAAAAKQQHQRPGQGGGLRAGHPLLHTAIGGSGSSDAAAISV